MMPSMSRPLSDAPITSARASPYECFTPGGRLASHAAAAASPSASASENMCPASLVSASDPDHRPAPSSMNAYASVMRSAGTNAGAPAWSS